MTDCTPPQGTDAPARLRPWNAALRFMLELWALVAMGYGIGQLTAGWLRPLAMTGLPLMAAAAWGTFTVPGDPSRGKSGPLPVSGRVRLALEAGFFGSACALLLLTQGSGACLALAVLVVLHYGLCHERTRWLWSMRR